MLSFLPKPLRAVLSGGLFALNTLFWCITLYIFAILKFIIPLEFFRTWMTKIMIEIAEIWVSINNLNLALFQDVEWSIELPAGLDPGRSYLVLSNHRSWVDIVVIQKVLNRRVPFLRFFLKKELIYVPLLGLTWWALDFPFMKRYSADFLKKNPHKRGEDLLTTKKACDKFKGRAVSVINFLEGTRLTPSKKEKQNSPFKHLLKPKAGGVAFVLSAMGEQFDSILDVTIVYPHGVKSLGQTFAGQLTKVSVIVRKIPIPKELLGGDYLEDPVFREKMQSWVSEVWKQKDALIETELV